MRLSKEMMMNMKNVLAHNVAQKLLIGRQESKKYLADLKEVLNRVGVDEDQTDELIIYAKMKGRAEVKILRSMQERYGIDIGVSGHGGSSASIEVLIEIVSTKSGK